MLRVAEISVHTCPLMSPGGRYTGGLNVYLLNLARELGKIGIAVDVFARMHDPAEPQIVDVGPNARVIHIKAGNWKEAREEAFPHLPEFLCNLRYFAESRRLSYQLLHSHYWLSGWVGSLIKKRWSIPHVASFHTLAIAKMEALPEAVEPDIRLSTERMIAQEADGIVSFTPSEEDSLMSEYGVPREKIRVIPAGVDLELFRPMNKEEARERLGLGFGKERILLFVGRPDPIKGLDLLLQAVSMVQEGMRPRVVVVGGSPEEGREIFAFMKMAEKLGLGKLVSFVGAVPQGDLPLYYNAADVCAMPSYYESFGLVALEALACEVPLVASNVGIAQTLIKDGENGFLVPGHSPEPFANLLERLFHDPLLRAKMSRSARPAVYGLDWSSMAAKVALFYQQLVGGIAREGAEA